MAMPLGGRSAGRAPLTPLGDDRRVDGKRPLLDVQLQSETLGEQRLDHFLELLSRCRFRSPAFNVVARVQAVRDDRAPLRLRDDLKVAHAVHLLQQGIQRDILRDEAAAGKTARGPLSLPESRV